MQNKISAFPITDDMENKFHFINQIIHNIDKAIQFMIVDKVTGAYDDKGDDAKLNKVFCTQRNILIQKEKIGYREIAFEENMLIFSMTDITLYMFNAAKKSCFNIYSYGFMKSAAKVQELANSLMQKVNHLFLYNSFVNIEDVDKKTLQGSELKAYNLFYRGTEPVELKLDKMNFKYISIMASSKITFLSEKYEMFVCGSDEDYKLYSHGSYRIQYVVELKKDIYFISKSLYLLV